MTLQGLGFTQARTMLAVGEKCSSTVMPVGNAACLGGVL